MDPPMDPTADKHDATLDISSDDAPKAVYYKNTIPILIQNVNDHFMVNKITNELEIERLNREHAEMDKKIAAQLEGLEATRKESEKLDREMFEATEREKQAQARFKTTGEILNALKEETEKLRAHAKRLELKRLEITEKVQGFAQKRKRAEEYENQIKDLERKITELLNEPEVSANENLIKENGKLRRVLQEKKENFEIKLAKKNKIEKMKEDRLNLLKMIDKRQEENKAMKGELEKKKENLRKASTEMEAKWEARQEDLNNAITKRNSMMKDLEESKINCQKEQLKVEQLKTLTSKKEEELQNLKEKCAVKQNVIKEEREKKQEELQTEKEKLAQVEQQLQEQLDENAQKLSILKGKTRVVQELKAKKEELTVRVCDLKIQLVTRQFENKEMHHNIIGEKLRLEREEVEKLQKRNEELEEKRKEAQKKLEECPKVFEEKRKRIEESHKGKIEALIKQQNFHKATMEFVQHTLDNNLKEAERLKKEIKELEADNDWKEMAYERRTITSNNFKEKVRKEQLAYEKLLERAKQVKLKSFEKTEPEENMAVDEKSVPQEEKLSEFSERKSPVKVLKESESMAVTEDRASLSGRRSPGILKTTFRNPQTSPKRVTFQGLSSTESSSASIDANKGGGSRRSVEEVALDEMLKDWTNSTRDAHKKSAKKSPMDF